MNCENANFFKKRFVDISNLYEPIQDGVSDGIYISKSLDSSSHFETVVVDVKSVYKRLTGEELKIDGKVKKVGEDGVAEWFSFVSNKSLK